MLDKDNVMNDEGNLDSTCFYNKDELDSHYDKNSDCNTYNEDQNKDDFNLEGLELDSADSDVMESTDNLATKSEHDCLQDPALDENEDKALNTMSEATANTDTNVSFASVKDTDLELESKAISDVDTDANADTDESSAVSSTATQDTDTSVKSCTLSTEMTGAVSQAHDFDSDREDSFSSEKISDAFDSNESDDSDEIALLYSSAFTKELTHDKNSFANKDFKDTDDAHNTSHDDPFTKSLAIANAHEESALNKIALNNSLPDNTSLTREHLDDNTYLSDYMDSSNPDALDYSDVNYDSYLEEESHFITEGKDFDSVEIKGLDEIDEISEIDELNDSINTCPKRANASLGHIANKVKKAKSKDLSSPTLETYQDLVFKAQNNIKPSDKNKTLAIEHKAKLDDVFNLNEKFKSQSYDTPYDGVRSTSHTPSSLQDATLPNNENKGADRQDNTPSKAKRSFLGFFKRNKSREKSLSYSKLNNASTLTDDEERADRELSTDHKDATYSHEYNIETYNQDKSSTVQRKSDKRQHTQKKKVKGKQEIVHSDNCVAGLHATALSHRMLKYSSTVMVFGLFALSFALIAFAFVIYISQKSSFVPYIVAVDKHGLVIPATDARDVDAIPNEVIVSELCNFITNMHLVSNDLNVQDRAIRKTVAYIKDVEMKSQIRKFYESKNPYRLIEDGISVSIEINSMIKPDRGNTYQIEWLEHTYKKATGTKKTKAYLSIIGYELLPGYEKDTEQFLLNPMSLFVTYYAQSQIKEVING